MRRLPPSIQACLLPKLMRTRTTHDKLNAWSMNTYRAVRNAVSSDMMNWGKFANSSPTIHSVSTAISDLPMLAILARVPPGVLRTVRPYAPRIPNTTAPVRPRPRIGGPISHSQTYSFPMHIS